MNILLVEPEFPIPCKSRNHTDFLPIGLLKLASYHRSQRDRVRLVRGNRRIPRFPPDLVGITSLFTYWSGYVWESVRFYKELYPRAKVVVGGIYASLMPRHCKKSGCDEVFVGVHEHAEQCRPAYDLVDVDYQVVHATRGCVRRCGFCGTWKIEPKFTHKKSIAEEICSNRIIFYDNNLLANPHIENILEELAEARYNGRAVRAESQCGLDGRLLTPKLASMLKKARFASARIAWDGAYKEHRLVKEQVNILIGAGYRARDIYVFMIYNYDIDYYELLRKIKLCREWGVQVADCRFRPLIQTFDNYDPKRKQTCDDYYIHAGWTDRRIKSFRRKVRHQNITIRYGFDYYSRDLENLGKRRRSRVSGPA